MSRNTFILILILAVLAGLLIAFNIRKSVYPDEFASIMPTSTMTPTPTSTQPLTYQNVYCGIALTYPSSLALQEGATGSATFIDAFNDQNTVYLACQKKIPTVSITPDKIENATVAGLPAKFYHGSFGQNDTPLTIAIFHNTKTNVDILISGAADTFTAIVKSIKLLP